MNYFAHFFIDHADERPHYTAGLILPDLVRNTHRNLRLPALNLPHYTPDNPITHLNEGVARHHFIDHRFHNSPFFEQQLSGLKALLYARSFESIVKYRYFLAHVLLEMMIDAVLIEQYPKRCSAFYQQLAATDEKVLTIYLATSGITDEQIGQILTHFSRFHTSQYLYHYRHTAGLLFGLEQMYRRFVPVVFTKADKQKLADCMEQFTPALNAGLHQLFMPDGIFGG